jgi:biopolymer transport protein ExbD
VGRDQLKARLDEKTHGNTDERVFVRADKSVDYGDLMEVLNLLRTTGYLKIGLVGLETLPPAGGVAPASAPQTPSSAAGGQ